VEGCLFLSSENYKEKGRRDDTTMYIRLLQVNKPIGKVEKVRGLATGTKQIEKWKWLDQPRQA
jgi:hypothetical protein